MKRTMLLIGGVCAGICLTMLYLHRGMICAAIKGEEMPEAPGCCPACKHKAEEAAEEAEATAEEEAQA